MVGMEDSARLIVIKLIETLPAKPTGSRLKSHSVADYATNKTVENSKLMIRQTHDIPLL